jgi:hypothetical protein
MTQSPFDLTKFRSDLDQLKGLTPEQQDFVLKRLYPERSPDSELFGGLLERMERLNSSEEISKRLTLANELDKDRMREAGKYKAMFDLPNTLINAYSVPSRIQAQGAADIAQMMSQGAANIPNLTNYQRGSFNFSPNRYF